MLSTQTPSEVSYESSDDQISEQDQYLLPLVDPDSLEPIFNYVTALNLALTGDLSNLKASAAFGCGCLDIAKRLESFFPTASLIGAGFGAGFVTGFLTMGLGAGLLLTLVGGFCNPFWAVITS